MRIIDVSSNNTHPINWQAVAAAGIAAAAIKATEGTTYTNPDYAIDWQEAKDAGLIRIAYHLAQPNQNTDPRTELNHFLATTLTHGPLQPGDLIMLDLEYGQGDLFSWALDWLTTANTLTHAIPLFYSGDWFARPHDLEGHPELAAYPLWLSAYQATIPPNPPAWTHIALWQNTNAAQIPGINGPCDQSTFFGSPADLATFAIT